MEHNKGNSNSLSQSPDMTTKRIYVAGKIGNLPEEVWQMNFLEARNEVFGMGCIPVCPTKLPHNHGRTWSEYMKEDLAAMLTCDGVYAQRNWQDSPGATIEVNLAKAIGMEIIYQP